MKLSNSRRAFRRVVWESSSEIWGKLHEDAFAKFGGAPHTIRLDNLKEGVLRPDIYDPQLNPLYAKMLEHYGVVPLPCRPYAPDLKGKVESEIGYTQETALKGRRFETIEEQNAYLDHWDERWAMTRIHGTTKRQVRAMFEEEKPFLQAAPAGPVRVLSDLRAHRSLRRAHRGRRRVLLSAAALCRPQSSGSRRPAVAAHFGSRNARVRARAHDRTLQGAAANPRRRSAQANPDQG